MNITRLAEVVQKMGENENVIKACELPLKTGVAFSSRQ
jgi:hypothetical protein